jgi:1-acyl-sn-glycerol-3-phosphate acyltransferase
MRFLRNIFGRIFFVYALLVFVITMLVIIVPVWLVSLLPEPRRARALHPIFELWMGVYMPLVFCPVVRKGKKNFKKGQNYVVVLNHNSLADIPVSSPWIPGANKTLAKVELSRVPLFGLIYKTGSILVDRNSERSRGRSVVHMVETLHQGTHLCLYPEGTRNKSDKPLQPFYDGAFITAIRAQKPVIPGLIFHTGKVLPSNKQFFALPHMVEIHFLEQIPTEGLSLKDVQMLKELVYRTMETYYTEHNNN